MMVYNTHATAVRQKRTVNSLAHASAEQDCDDPCHLCELLMDYMDEGVYYYSYCHQL